jgi:benzoyl-CoA reductase/2-hydroxyglutaryl-CoA dehydratase subunit BcrC/BadD/HgdB
MYGPLGSSTITDIQDCAREYKINGCIYYAFVGCRHTCATVKLFKDVLTEMDVPVLTLDCDIIDPTINPQSDVREKLERFFELLEDR